MNTKLLTTKEKKSLLNDQLRFLNKGVIPKAKKNFEQLDMFDLPEENVKNKES